MGGFRRTPPRTVFVHEYVTGGGLAGQDLPPSWAREGGAMRRALAEDLATIPDVRVLMTLDDRLPDEPGPWEVVRVGPGEEEAVVANQARRAEGGTILVAPETDGLLAERAGWIAACGGRSLGSTPEAIALAGQKDALGELLARHAIATPTGATIRAGQRHDPGSWSFPLVVKPLDGAGCLDTWLVREVTELPADFGRSGSRLVQPFVPGIPMSASFLVDRDGVAHLVGVGRQEVVVEAGQFSYRGGTVPAGTLEMASEPRRAVELLAPLGLRGWAGVDFLWDEPRGAVILEVNPRLTTSYVGLRRLLSPGALARAWLLAFDDPAALATLDLARRVHASPPTTFSADGTILAAGDAHP